MMTTWPRKFAALALSAALMVVVACSTADDNTGPTLPSELQAGGTLLSLADLHLLSCSAQPYAVKTQTVGTAGGTIVIGTHRLVIPAGAQAKPVQIKAEQVTGRVNSVRFSPEGLKFAKPATLTLSYGNCSPLLLLKRVVYTNELLSILELLPSVDDLRTRTVSASIRHFSRYAVAW
ncbi:MAG: hypothetical protein ACJ8DJ_05050 [Gemmatimonadales bacterium]